MTGHATGQRRRRHGQKRRILPPDAGKPSGDPVLDDLLAGATAVSLSMATSGIKQLALAGAISDRSASRWRVEGRGNPVFDLTGIVYWLARLGQHAGVLIAHLNATLAHGLMPISPDELVTRFWDLMGAESEAEGRENRASSMFARSGDLYELERATLDEAGVQHELAAVCRELRRRKIDPRTWRQS